MNIIKKVIVIVMGIVTIGVLSTAIGISTQTKTINKSVTFEILTETTVTSGTYNLILEYSIIDELDLIINITNFNVNDIVVDNQLYIYDNEIAIENNIGDQDYIQENDIFRLEDAWLNVGDIISITFEVEVETPVIVKILLALAPLVLTTAVIMFVYKGFGNKE